MKNSTVAMFVSLALLTGFTSTPAQAAVATFPCGTSGSYTVSDGVLTGHSDCVGDLRIDVSVVEIGFEAFASNPNLTAIYIPGNVITVGENAFIAASATSLTLGDGIIEIKANAFAQLNNFGPRLLDIVLPDSVTTLGDGAFQQVRTGKIVIGDSITNIPRQAFYTNFGGGANSIDFGSSVTEIGFGAFFGYRGDTLFFPEGLRTIQGEAFQGAYAAHTVLLPNSITSIASDAFQISPTTTLYCGSNSGIAEYVFPAPNNAKVCANLVRFERNGALNNQPAQQASSTSVNLTTLNWTKLDSSFVGWTSNPDGTGAQYAEGGLFPFASRFTTLYAQWQAIPKVVFDRNTGQGEMDDQFSLEAANLDASQFYRCGFDFNGWSPIQNGGSTLYPDQASFPFLDLETRLYAQWTPRGADFNRVKSDVTWNPMNGSPGVSDLNDGTVLTMVVNPITGDLYAGGTFRDVAGIAEADYIAKWDGSSWSALGSNGSGDGALAQWFGAGGTGVYDLAFDNLGNLFVTGKFNISGVAPYVAKWDGSNWTSVGTGSEFSDSGRAIVVDSRNHVYVGGHFNNVSGDSTIDYLAKWDGAAWLGVGNALLGDVVKSIDLGLNDSIYIGSFSQDIGGISEADFIAKWNGSEWSALGGTLDGQGQLRGMPRNITVDSRSGTEVVYVGSLNSRMSDFEGNTVNYGYLVKWDGTRWDRALPDVLFSNNYVSDVALAPGGGLVIGGWFNATDSIFGDYCNNYQSSLAYFDGTNTFGLGLSGSDASFSDDINAVVFNNEGHLIVGGSFTSASGDPRASRVAVSSISLGRNLIAIPTPTTSIPVPSPFFTLESRPLVSTKGQTLTLNGSNLGNVTAISVAGKEVVITRKSADEIVIEVPAGPEGDADVEVISPSGKLTMKEWIQVIKPYANKRTQKITQFKGYLPTQAGLAALKKMYMKSPEANLLSCVATVAQNASESQVARAEAQAAASCKSVLKYAKFIRSADVAVNKIGVAGSKPMLAVTFDRTLSGM